MPLLGAAAVAMWWDMASALRSEFEDWHSHEHFPERMGVPGFLRGSRWASDDGREGFFVLYELETYETLVSPGYLARLNDPTPWSRKMMPHHQGMVRSQCRVVESIGAGIARFAWTIRFSPEKSGAPSTGDALAQRMRAVALGPGLTGMHLLVTDTPRASATTEQKIRGGDAVADWILLLTGYEREALERAQATLLDADRQAPPSSRLTSIFQLSATLAEGELRPAVS